MKRELVISLIFHLVLVTAAIVSSPFEPEKKINYDDIVRVTLPSASQIPEIKPEAPAPIEIPKALVEADPDIPIDAPTTKPAVKIEKPKTTKKPQTKPKPKNQPPPSNAENSNKTQTGSEEGRVSSASVSGGGTTISGVRVGNASFTYDWWIGLALQKINGNFRFSYSYDGSLVCIVYFEVIQSGRVLNIKVEQSSGVPQFDEVCLRAVEKSAPFPPLPRDFTDEIVTLAAPFTWHPR